MKKKIILCVGILLLTALLLGLFQAVLMPKYMTDFREGALIGEYYGAAGGNDVLFVGDCEVYESFTPPTLWEEYGITSYVRGSAQQLIWQSYYLLEEMLETETPRVVVFNVYAMKYGEPQDEAANRKTLDGMRWSLSKLSAIQASKTEEESFLSYVFPILRFHSRWNQLSGEDFQYLFKKETVSHNGYMMQTAIDPKPEAPIQAPSLGDYTLPSVSFEYLDKMHALCKEKGAELILVKAPTNTRGYYWYDEWDAQIVDYAEENGLDYYNFIPLCEEIGIDWNTDTYDRGYHLNVYGAEKLTSYFGKLLSEAYGVPDRRGEADTARLWDEKVTAYQKEKNGET
ncbi:MAG: SGNH/GDSL hydrolase family protein [Ruminococcaceae bacterium]|nr:SGNH/GDSL hydrolase family protein [Oscillospiraceae bacterium]